MAIPRSPCVVIDTHVWISGLLTKAGTLPELAWQVMRHGHPILTAATFEELTQRLWLPRFDRYVTMKALKQLLQDIDVVVYRVEVTGVLAMNSVIYP